MADPLNKVSSRQMQIGVSYWCIPNLCTARYLKMRSWLPTQRYMCCLLPDTAGLWDETVKARFLCQAVDSIADQHGYPLLWGHSLNTYDHSLTQHSTSKVILCPWKMAKSGGRMIKAKDCFCKRSINVPQKVQFAATTQIATFMAVRFIPTVRVWIRNLEWRWAKSKSN